MNTPHIHDIIIIGGGPVGLFTAFYGALRDADIRLIESLEILGGQPVHLYPEKLIYDIPAYSSITGAELRQRMVEQLQRFDIPISLGEEVLHIEQTGTNPIVYKVTTSNSHYYTHAVIVATGNGAFRPRRLSLDNTDLLEGAQLHYYAHQLDKFRNQQVVICGGGDSAIDWALALEPIASSVTLIHRRPQFRAMEHNVHQLRASSVNVLTPFVPHELIMTDGKLTHLVINESRTNNFQTLPLDHCIVSYGFVSNSGTFAEWGLDMERQGITVDSHYMTNMPNIYAVGDIATYPGKIKMIAAGFSEGPMAINHALHAIYPDRKHTHQHSSSIIKE